MTQRTGFLFIGLLVALIENETDSFIVTVLGEINEEENPCG